MEVLFLSASVWHMEGLLLFSLPDLLHKITAYEAEGDRS